MSAALGISNPSNPEIAAYVQELRGNRKQRRKREALDRRLVLVYGIDAEDWARMYEAQGGRCAGCLAHLESDRSTHTDHCHKTKKVRGLLCDGCNSALGQVCDNTETLRRLAAYLER